MPVDVFFSTNREPYPFDSGNGDPNRRAITTRLKEIFNLSDPIIDDEEELWVTDWLLPFSGF